MEKAQHIKRRGNNAGTMVMAARAAVQRDRGDCSQFDGGGTAGDASCSFSLDVYLSGRETPRKEATSVLEDTSAMVQP